MAGLRVVWDDFPAVSFMTRARALPATSREKARAAWLISQFNSQVISHARWLVYIIPTPFSNTVHTWFHIKRFRGTKRLWKPIWCNLKRLFGTKSCQAGGLGYDCLPFCRNVTSAATPSATSAKIRYVHEREAVPWFAFFVHGGKFNVSIIGQ